MGVGKKGGRGKEDEGGGGTPYPGDWRNKGMPRGHWMEKVVEEIALEGLDGITLQALRLRLENRTDMQLEDFEVIAPFLWRYLRSLKTLQFYLLPETRPDLERYCWYANRDERGNFIEPIHAPEEIYLYYPVEDKEKGIRGSCAHYETRRDISEIARKSGYEQIIQGLGNRLVIVACQWMREQALFGGNYKKHVGLSVVQYCIMERIGRARYTGEVTRGKISSGCLNIQAKTQFYLRKHLLKAGLMTKQNASIKFPGGKCPAAVSVFHLPRFYHRIEPMAHLNLRTIFCWLNSSPTHSVSVDKVVKRYGKHTLRALVNSFPTLVRTEWEQRPFAQSKPVCDNPDEPQIVEPPPPPKGRNVRVVRLLVTDQAIQNQLISKVLEDGEEDDGTSAPASTDGDGEEEGGAQDLGRNSPNSFAGVQVLRPEKQLLFSTHWFSLCRAVMQSGLGGLTQVDIANLTGISRLESRGASRVLIRHNICTEGMVKIFKHKAFTYKLISFSETKGNNKDLMEIMEGLQDKLLTALEEMERWRGVLRNLEERRLREKMRRLRRSKRICSKLVAAKKEVPREDGDILQIEGISEEETEINIPEEPETQEVPEPENSASGTEVQAPVAPACPPSSSQPCLVLVLSENTPPEPTIGSYAAPPPEGLLGESHELKLLTSPHLPKCAIFREDATDLSIRENLTRLRVAWTRNEDKFLLTAYIASALFISKYSLDRIFVYNSLQLRDLLLQRSNGRSNKTSTSIRRRLQFLLRQDKYMNWYVKNLNQVLRDNQLYDVWVRNSMPPPGGRLFCLPPLDKVGQLTDYLMTKLDGEVVQESEVVRGPRFQGIDTLLFLRQLKRAEHFWRALQFCIFLKLGSTADEKREFFKKWRENEGRGYSTEGEEMGRIEMYWNYCWRFLKFLGKHFEQIFRSISLEGNLEESKNVCLARRECGGYANDLKTWVNRCRILEQIFSGRGLGLDEDERDCPDLDKAAMQLLRGRVLVRPKGTHLLRLRKRQVRTFLNGLPLKDLDELWEFLDYTEQAEVAKVDVLACLNVGVFQGLVELTEAWTAEITRNRDIFSLNMDWARMEEVNVMEDGQDEGEEEKEETRGTKRKWEGPPGKKGRKRWKKKECKMVTRMALRFGGLKVSEEVKENGKPEVAKKKGKKGKIGLGEGETYQSDRIRKNTLQLLKLKEGSEGVKNGDEGPREDQALDVTLPGLQFKFGTGGENRSQVNCDIVGDPQPFDVEGLKKLRKALVELVYHRADMVQGGVLNLKPLLGKYSAIFEVISLTGSVGVSGPGLSKIFELEHLKQGLQYLMEGRLVFGVGVVRRRFVSFNNVNDWVVPIKAKVLTTGGGAGQKEKKRIEGSVIMRPWITANGGISWSTVSRLINALVGQLNKPEVRLEEVLTLFAPTLSQVETLVLVEALAKLEYVTVYKLKEPKVTLFSEHKGGQVEIEYNAETLISTENRYLAVSPFITTLHAQLNHAIQRTSRKIALANCNAN